MLIFLLLLLIFMPFFMHVQFKPHIKLSCMAYAIKPLDPLSVILTLKTTSLNPAVYLLHARTMQKERHLTHLLTLSRICANGPQLGP